MAKKTKEIWEQQHLGKKREILFREAATKFLEEKLKQDLKKKTIKDYAMYIKQLDPYLGNVPIQRIHNDTPELRDYINSKQPEKGERVKNRTVNGAIVTIISVLTYCARLWRHEDSTPWLSSVPMIHRLPLSDSRPPYPITWEEQKAILREVPKHIGEMILFAVNTGCRSSEITNLQWDWMKTVEGVNIFWIPGKNTKNGEDKLIVLNDVADRVVQSLKGVHPKYVFTLDGKKLVHVATSAFKRARLRSGVPMRIHDLRHTFGSRLDYAGVHHLDKKVLMGHKLQDITSHYSRNQVTRLHKEVNKICGIDWRGFVPLRAVN